MNSKMKKKQEVKYDTQKQTSMQTNTKKQEEQMARVNSYISSNVVAKFSKMPNTANNCWLNAIMQAMGPTKIVSLFLEDLSIDQEDTLKQKISDIWTHLRNEYPRSVPEKKINCLYQPKLTRTRQFSPSSYSARCISGWMSE